MDIPSYIPMRVIDDNGYLTPEWSNLFNQLISQLQLNLGNEGFVLPQLTTTQISELTDTAKSKGALVYDSVTNQVKANLNGTWTVL
jgi:hypothetical protein